MSTVTAPVISIKVDGNWVPINTLDAEQQAGIRHRVAEVLGQAIERQIAILADRPAASTR